MLKTSSRFISARSGANLIFLFMIVTMFTQAEEPPALIEAAGSELSLIKIPMQDLSTLETTVAEQLKQSHQLVKTLAAKGSASQELADAYGELGRLYQAYEINQAAEICYTNARRLDPNQFQWNYYQAYLYQNSGRHREALALYQQIATLHPQPTLIKVRIGEVYQALNRLAEARQFYLQAFYLHPQAPAVLARLGELAVEEKQYRSAISFLDAALSIQPEANRLHYPLAMAHRGMGNTEQAVSHLRQRGTVGIQPYDPWIDNLKNLLQGERSHLLRGKLAYSAGRYEESIQAFQTALSFNRDSARAHINLGTALMQTGKTEEAIDHHLKALALEPDNLTAHYNLGFLYLNSANAKAALPHLEKVSKNDPEDANAHLLMAQALEHNQRIEEAMDYYRKTVLIDPTAAGAWLGGSRLLVQNKEYAKALGVLNQAYKNLPNNGLISHALAKLLAASPDESLRDGEAALPLALKVYQAKPSAGHALTVAMAYAESGECSQAVSWQQRAIETLSPNNNRMGGILQKDLLYYQNNRPCRYGMASSTESPLK